MNDSVIEFNALLSFGQEVFDPVFDDGHLQDVMHSWSLGGITRQHHCHQILHLFRLVTRDGLLLPIHNFKCQLLQ